MEHLFRLQLAPPNRQWIYDFSKLIEVLVSWSEHQVKKKMHRTHEMCNMKLHRDQIKRTLIFLIIKFTVSRDSVWPQLSL